MYFIILDSYKATCIRYTVQCTPLSPKIEGALKTYRNRIDCCILTSSEFKYIFCVHNTMLLNYQISSLR